VNAGDANSSPTQAAVRPIPPRYWWLKRILVGVGVLLAALTGLRWWWGWEAERRLEAKIAEYRAAGQPVLAEDFARPAVADEENAAKLYYRARAALVSSLRGRVALDDGTSIELSLDGLLERPEVFTSRREAVGSLMEANAVGLKLIDEARLRPALDWGLPSGWTSFGATFPMLTGQRSLARLACINARYRHSLGDDAGAIDALRDGLTLGQNTGEMVPLLICQLARGAIDRLIVQAVEDIRPGLRFSDAPEWESPSSRAAMREQIELLIAQLLDESGVCQEWVRAMYGERLLYLAAARDVTSGSLSWSPLAGPVTGRTSFLDRAVATLLGPTITLDALRMAEGYARLAQGSSAPTWPAARALLPADRDDASGVQHVARPLSCFGAASNGLLWVPSEYRSLADRRMAAAALAIRLFEVDQGRRPAALYELVPEYLPAVPRDPFAADGRGIGYAPEAPHPVLYSVGLDGVDNGGEFALAPRGVVDRDAKDIPFFLDGDRPRSKSALRPPSRSVALTTSQTASTQAVDGDQHIDDGRRDRDENR
jgi:hypothetical protein